MSGNVSDIELYAVRDEEGKWYRRKGYGGYGESWVDNFKGVRIYTRIGDARKIVTYYSGEPDCVPEIVVFKLTETRVVKEETRIKDKIKKEEERVKKRRGKLLKKKLEEVQREYKDHFVGA